MEDTRNVMDEFKGMDHDRIVECLDKRGVSLEIAVENLERDFNMGTIVRSANAFGVRNVHIIGSKQWNKRGAMMTDKYLNLIYHKSVDDFIRAMRRQQLSTIIIENNVRSQSLDSSPLPQKSVLVFGSERSGVSEALLAAGDDVRSIPQCGSTRSLNVGVAAGIAMWQWYRDNTSR